MRVSAIRNLSTKVQVIDGVAYESGEMVPIEVATLPDGRINPNLGPPPDARRRARRDGGGCCRETYEERVRLDEHGAPLARE